MLIQNNTGALSTSIRFGVSDKARKELVRQDHLRYVGHTAAFLSGKHPEAVKLRQSLEGLSKAEIIRNVLEYFMLGHPKGRAIAASDALAGSSRTDDVLPGMETVLSEFHRLTINV